MKIDLTLEDMFRLKKLAHREGKTVEEMASFLVHRGCLTSVACKGILIFTSEVKQPNYPDITPDVLIAAESEEELPYGE